MEQRQKTLLFKLLSLLLLLLLLLPSSFVKLLIYPAYLGRPFPIFKKRKKKRTTKNRGERNEVLDKLFLTVVEAIDFLNFESCMAVSWV